MIKAKIEWTSIHNGNPTEGDPFDRDSVTVVETERRNKIAGVKEFNNEKEMLDYAFSNYDGEVIISKQFLDEGIDYDIELYNWYRE